MKKIHIIAIGILCVLPSCLDVKIVDRVAKESGFYKTEDHAKSAIYATYTTLTDFAYHKTNWPLILSTYEDAMFSTGSAVPATVSNNTHNPNSGPCVIFWPTL